MEISMPVQVSKRDKTGSIASRRLRKQGQIPANVYGHKQTPQAIAISEEIVRAILAAGERVIDISLDGSVETTMLKDLQWDSFGIEIMHVDLFRVDSDEKVAVEVGHCLFDQPNRKVAIVLSCKEMGAHQRLVKVRSHLGHKHRVMGIEYRLGAPGVVGMQ